MPGCPTAPTRVGFRAHHLAAEPTARPAAIVFPATVALTEITGSESFVHLERDGVQLGRACCPASTSSRPARRSRRSLDPDDIFVFDPTAGWSPRPTAG